MIQKRFDEETVATFKGKCLRDLVTIKGETPTSLFPDLGPLIKEFAESFDKDIAMSEQVPPSSSPPPFMKLLTSSLKKCIVPFPGKDENYDEATKKVETIEKLLNDYLAKQKRQLGVSKLHYVKMGNQQVHLI